jgi:hypothetical protein
MTDTMTATRPVMTSAELNGHRVSQYGRDYRESDDGYGDMAAESKRGWQPVSGWGADGWDLGDWPYVVIYVRPARNRFAPDKSTTFGLMQICEGDRTVYEFTSRADRDAAIDYQFLWYAAGQHWAPLTCEQRAELDAGSLTVDPKFRGPYSVRRHGVAASAVA